MEPERMMIARELRSFVATLAAQIKISNRNGLTDLSRSQEKSLLGLINKVYSRMFKDLNEYKLNYPALDYGEYTAGLGLQMTATVAKQKFEDTLSKMRKHSSLKNNFREIWFFLLTVDSIPSAVQVTATDIDVKYITLNDMVNRITQSETSLQIQREFLQLAKREYASYFICNANITEDKFQLNSDIPVPRDLKLFNEFIDTVSWFSDDPMEGYQKIYDFINNFRLKLRLCFKDSRILLSSILSLSNFSHEKNKKIELYLEHLMGALNITEENFDDFNFHLNNLEGHYLIDIQDEYQEIYAKGEDLFFKNNRKIILNYHLYEPEINIYVVLCQFYKNYHSLIEFEHAIKNSDFSLLSDFRCNIN